MSPVRWRASPPPAVEKRVAEAVARFFDVGGLPGAIPHIQRVTVSKESLLIELHAGVLDPVLARARLAPGEHIDFDGEAARLRVPIAVKKWRGTQHIFDAGGRPALPGSVDGTLVQAIAKAHALAPGVAYAQWANACRHRSAGGPGPFLSTSHGAARLPRTRPRARSACWI